MTYTFVTRADLINADHLRLEGADSFRDLWEIAERLMAERDAYRKVAMNWVISEWQTHTRTKGKCVEEVDAEARRLLGGDTVRILEGK